MAPSPDHENQRLKKLLLETKAENQELLYLLEESQRAHTGILNSRYWRIGEPLRQFITHLRGLHNHWRGQPKPLPGPIAPGLRVRAGDRPHSPNLPTLLVVSHSASATDAQILALNLC